MDQSDERWGIWIGLKPGNKIANYSVPISKYLKLGYKTHTEIQSKTRKMIPTATGSWRESKSTFDFGWQDKTVTQNVQSTSLFLYVGPKEGLLIVFSRSYCNREAYFGV